MMLTPGADSSTDEFRSEKDARCAGLRPPPPTEITPVNAAGYEYGV